MANENKPLDSFVSPNNPDWLNDAISNSNLVFGWIEGLRPQLFYQIGSPPTLIGGTIDIPGLWGKYHTSFISDYLLKVIEAFKSPVKTS